MTPIKLRTSILLSAMYLFLASVQGVVHADDEQGPTLACPGPSLAPRLREFPDRESAPISVKAWQFDAGKTGTAEARDQVELRRADQLLITERLLYEPETKTVIMPGRLDYRDSVLYVSGASASYSFLNEGGQFSEVSYGLTGSSARGTATHVTVDSGNHSLLRQLQFTTCPGENPQWNLTAKELELDFNKGIGKAKNAKLEFFDIPFLYLPYMTFPIDDRRKSGFLYPFISTANDTGFEFGIPYYWNIAANHDATFTPKYYTERGAMLTAEYRFITRRTRGNFNVDYMPDDSRFDKSRYHYRLLHTVNINRRWQTKVLVDRVSDNFYFQDFSNSLAGASRQYLKSSAGIFGGGHYWRLAISADDFQVVDETININREPYTRVPRVVFDIDRPLGSKGLRLRLDSELVYFDREFNVGPTGSRFDIYPRLEWEIGTSWGYMRPSAGYRYTTYDLDYNGLPGETSPDRGLEILSFDTGLFFERDTGKNRVQTLEPRLFYLYVPYKNQQDLPDFDSAPFTFGFSQLFHFNYFTGADRQSDANQLTFALTTRSISQRTGRELWSMSLGQILYFKNQRVLPADFGQPLNEDFSSLLAEFILHPTKQLSSRINMEWDWHNSHFNAAVLNVTHTSSTGRRIGAEYRYRRNSLDQFDIRYYQPINESWLVLGRVNYSLKDDDLLAAEIGFEYDSCCWGLRVVGKRFLRNRSKDHRDAIYVQLILKGLGGLGRRNAPLFYDLAP